MHAASALFIVFTMALTRLGLDKIVEDFRCGCCRSRQCDSVAYLGAVCSHLSSAVLLALFFLHALITAAFASMGTAGTTEHSQQVQEHQSCRLL